MALNRECPRVTLMDVERGVGCETAVDSSTSGVEHGFQVSMTARRRSQPLKVSIPSHDFDLYDLTSSEEDEFNRSTVADSASISNCSSLCSSSASTPTSSISPIDHFEVKDHLFKGRTKRRTRKRRKLVLFSVTKTSVPLQLQQHLQHHQRQKRSTRTVHPTALLPILNGVDMLAVSLVVPLFFQYYKAAGVTNAAQRELLSSVFSASQILGGLLLPVLTDSCMLSRKSVLLLSFGGSALSYALICWGGLSSLVLSRILVGLVKQTMTICTTILTQYTCKDNRAKILGQLNASSTMPWIVGPTVGAVLYKYVDTRAPAMVAIALFLINTIVAWVWLDDLQPDEHRKDPPAAIQPPNPKSLPALQSNNSMRLRLFTWSPIVHNLRVCFSSTALGSAVVVKLLLAWITRATNYNSLGSFYEDMYGLEAHHRGYINSYQQVLHLIVNLRLVAPILEWSGGERHATLYCAGLMTVAVFLESRQCLPLFLLVLCPTIALCCCISELSTQTLVTHVTPSTSMFSVLAALDVLQNAVSVTVPLYRTFLFQILHQYGQYQPSSSLVSFVPKTQATFNEKDALDASSSTTAIMNGDPDPVTWVYTSAMHWGIGTLFLSIILTKDQWWKEEDLVHNNWKLLHHPTRPTSSTTTTEMKKGY